MDSITPDLDEALRYAGVRADESGDMHRKMAEIAAQCMKTVTPRCTYRVSEIAWENGMPSLFGGQLVLPGRTAAVMLRSCSHAALLVCTLGTTFDALARQVQARDFADALLLDGFGGAYVEAGCNAAEREIAAKLPGKYLTDRFSPGYGDLPLDVQSFAVIDAQGGFQCGGVGGIQLKRHIHRFLQFPDHAREHGDFIHARIADVDVQNLRARVHLRNGDIDDVIQIARQ